MFSRLKMNEGDIMKRLIQFSTAAVLGAAFFLGCPGKKEEAAAPAETAAPATAEPAAPVEAPATTDAPAAPATGN